MNDCCRIERAVNGYTVSLRDPEAVKANAAPKTQWKDPNREYVFDSVEKVLAFLGKTLDKALPMDEYGTSFSKALTEVDDD